MRRLQSRRRASRVAGGSAPGLPPGRRGKLRALTGAVALGAAVLFYGLENWRGHRAWRLHQARLEEQGFVYRWDDIKSPAIPAAQNFWEAPSMRDWFLDPALAEDGGAVKLPSLVGDYIDWRFPFHEPHPIAAIKLWPRLSADRVDVETMKLSPRADEPIAEIR